MQLDEPVEIVAYDAAWPAMFAQEHVALREALAGAMVDIQHIGSTAVAGMSAKPIVDIQAGLKSYPAETSLLAGLDCATVRTYYYGLVHFYLEISGSNRSACHLPEP